MICLLRSLDTILYHIAKQLFVFFLLYILLEWDSSLSPSMMIGGTCHSIDRLPPCKKDFICLGEESDELLFAEVGIGVWGFGGYPIV